MKVTNQMNTCLTKSQTKGLDIALSHLYADNKPAAKRVLESLIRAAAKEKQQSELVYRFNAANKLHQITLWSNGVE